MPRAATRSPAGVQKNRRCFSSSSPHWCLHAPQRFHQIRNLDGFERTHSILDLPAHSLVGAANHRSVELLDGVFPHKRMGRDAWKILNHMLDHFAVLQPDDDFGRHLSGILVREFLIRPG
jgi:hypothetical protein